MDSEDNNCIILKRKEYEELVALANSKKPNKLALEIDIESRYGYVEIISELDLSEGLQSQIRRILVQPEGRVAKKIARMSRSQRRKFLKQYK